MNGIAKPKKDDKHFPKVGRIDIQLFKGGSGRRLFLIGRLMGHIWASVVFESVWSPTMGPTRSPLLVLLKPSNITWRELWPTSCIGKVYCWIWIQLESSEVLIRDNIISTCIVILEVLFQDDHFEIVISKFYYYLDMYFI